MMNNENEDFLAEEQTENDFSKRETALDQFVLWLPPAGCLKDQGGRQQNSFYSLKANTVHYIIIVFRFSFL